MRRRAYLCAEDVRNRLGSLADAEQREIVAKTAFDPTMLVGQKGVSLAFRYDERPAIDHGPDKATRVEIRQIVQRVAPEGTPNLGHNAVECSERDDSIVKWIIAVANEYEFAIHSVYDNGNSENSLGAISGDPMCGIAGIWRISPSDAIVSTHSMMEHVREMLRLLAHRGPDAEGFHVLEDRGVVGHCRLSIMDPTGGDQPIYTHDRSALIAANGEIYNFPDLRSGLLREQVFSTGSDSEAILHLYRLHGDSLVDHLEGMYAFAIVDGDRLILARDPLGIKPLYWAENDGVISFASEIKALAPLSTNVREFPPGGIFQSDIGVRIFRDIPLVTPSERPVDEYISLVRSTLEESVISHCMSDVGLGAFLSGGLDSSVIAALAIRHLGSLHTFSVGVEGSSDLAAARIVADFLGTTHHEYLITAQEVMDCLPEIIHSLESFDQDLVRSAVPCYFTSRLAAQHTKVILTGEGADELFAGYTYHRSIADPQELHKELRRTITTLHDINLQRADRLTMLHSIEGRVPFLDLKMVDLAQQIPVSLKLHGDLDNGESIIEKWVLRKAFEDLLPHSIVWRRKEQFDEGSGTADLLPRLLSAAMSEEEAANYRLQFPGVVLRSAEECYYHRILVSAYEHPEPVLANVARWAEYRMHDAQPTSGC